MLRISCEVAAEAWDAAASELAFKNRRLAPWQSPVPFDRSDLLVIGPEGLAWFDDGRQRVGYAGSLLYLADGLNEWLQTEGETSVIEGDSIYQSARVDLRVIGTSVEIAFGRVKGSDIIHVSLDEARRSMEIFLAEFGAVVVSRLPGLRDFTEVT